jgi:hypothetical protein
VLHIERIREFGVEDGAGEPRDVAKRYVTDNAAAFGIRPGMLDLDVEVGAPGEGSQLRLVDERRVAETTIITYGQTLDGLAVWEAGLAVVVSRYDTGTLRVTSVQSTLHLKPQVGKPVEMAPPLTPDSVTPAALTPLLGLSDAPDQPTLLRVNGQPRLLYYQYDNRDGARRGWTPPADGRTDEQRPVDPRLELLVPRLPEPSTLQPDLHYKVIETLFTVRPLPAAQPRPLSYANGQTAKPEEDGADMHWRAFIEPVTRAVVYLRPGAAACFGDMFPATAAAPVAGIVPATGKVFTADPVTLTRDDPYAPDQNPADASLKLLLLPVTLANVVAAPAGEPQRLRGKYVRLADLYSPVVDLPLDDTPPPPAFDFTKLPVSEANDFTAVHAYYHCDAMFRMLEQFNLLHTFFPDFQDKTLAEMAESAIRIDPQGMGNSIDALTGDDENLMRVNRIFFGRGRQWTADAEGATFDVGNALDVRVVLHEFGHVLMLPILRSPNFGFAHSAGDSLAAILHDPCSRVRQSDERYKTFPWLMHENPERTDWPWRYHGGPTANVAQWACKGDLYDQDTPYQQKAPGYLREQMLSATLFRAYQAIGGDATPANPEDTSAAGVAALKVRYLAARYMAYLIIRGIAGLPASTSVPTNTPDAYAAALMVADTATTSYTDPRFPAQPIRGGTVHKVIRWSFEQQGLYQRPGAPVPVIQAGQQPVDLHIGPAAY